MCIVFTCGEQKFRKQVEGYENVTCQCHNCGNYSGKVIKEHPWFTFCFIVSLPLPTRVPADELTHREQPVLPLSIHGFEDVVCSVCNFAQPLNHRPDVQQMR